MVTDWLAVCAFFVRLCVRVYVYYLRLCFWWKLLKAENNCQKWYCVSNVSRFPLVWKIYRLKNLQLIIVSSSINLHSVRPISLSLSLICVAGIGVCCPLNNFCVEFVMSFFSQYHHYQYYPYRLLVLLLRFSVLHAFECVNFLSPTLILTLLILLCLYRFLLDLSFEML